MQRKACLFGLCFFFFNLEMKYSIELDSHQCLAHCWMMLKATESKRIWNWLIARIASFLNWQPSVTLVLLSFAPFLSLFQFHILNDDSVMCMLLYMCVYVEKNSVMQSILLCRLPWQSLNKDSRQYVWNNGSLDVHNAHHSAPLSGLCVCYQWCFPFPVLQKCNLSRLCVKNRNECKWEQFKFLYAVVGLKRCCTRRELTQRRLQFHCFII